MANILNRTIPRRWVRRLLGLFLVLFLGSVAGSLLLLDRLSHDLPSLPTGTGFCMALSPLWLREVPRLAVSTPRLLLAPRGRSRVVVLPGYTSSDRATAPALLVSATPITRAISGISSLFRPSG